MRSDVPGIVLNDESADLVVQKIQKFVQQPTICSSMSETFNFTVKKDYVKKTASGIIIPSEDGHDLLIPFESIFAFFGNSIEIVFNETDYVHLFNF